MCRKGTRSFADGYSSDRSKQTSTHDEIDKAVGAHGQWKQKLRTAIDTGESESTPEKVKLDNNCSFGKWLHQRIDPGVRESPFYKKIVDLHARFHREAGAILELALKGQKEEATGRMKLGGAFSSTSAKLIATMKEWQTTL